MCADIYLNEALGVVQLVDGLVYALSVVPGDRPLRSPEAILVPPVRRDDAESVWVTAENGRRTVDVEILRVGLLACATGQSLLQSRSGCDTGIATNLDT